MNVNYGKATYVIVSTLLPANGNEISRIPIVVQGIRVPILVDTGSEVSVLSTEFVQRLFPEQDIPTGTRQVRAWEVNCSH